MFVLHFHLMASLEGHKQKTGQPYISHLFRLRGNLENGLSAGLAHVRVIVCAAETLSSNFQNFDSYSTAISQREDFFIVYNQYNKQVFRYVVIFWHDFCFFLGGGASVPGKQQTP